MSSPLIIGGVEERRKKMLCKANELVVVVVVAVVAVPLPISRDNCGQRDGVHVCWSGVLSLRSKQAGTNRDGLVSRALGRAECCTARPIGRKIPALPCRTPLTPTSPQAQAQAHKHTSNNNTIITTPPHHPTIAAKTLQSLTNNTTKRTAHCPGCVCATSGPTRLFPLPRPQPVFVPSTSRFIRPCSFHSILKEEKSSHPSLLSPVPCTSPSHSVPVFPSNDNPPGTHRPSLRHFHLDATRLDLDDHQCDQQPSPVLSSLPFPSTSDPFEP